MDDVPNIKPELWSRLKHLRLNKQQQKNVTPVACSGQLAQDDVTLLGVTNTGGYAVLKGSNYLASIIARSRKLRSQLLVIL